MEFLQTIDYVELLKLLLIIGLGGVSYYLRTYTNVQNKIAGFIAEAEQIYLSYSNAGKDKMAWCVAELNKYIPSVLKPILTDAILEALVQNVFDNITEYVELTKIKVGQKLDLTVDKIVKDTKK